MQSISQPFRVIPLSLALVLFLGTLHYRLGADTLVTANGQSFEGLLIGMEGGYIALQESERGSGSLAVRRFSQDEIRRIEFSDTDRRREALEIFENEKFAEAIPLLESLAFKRLPFMGLLQGSDEHVFSALLLSYSSSGLFEKCLERYKLWHRRLTQPDTLRKCHMAVMRSAWNAGQQEEAVLHAQRWIDAGFSSEDSAMAWRILAETELEKGHLERALWLSLNPIAFADRKTPPDSEGCYRIAIRCAMELDKRTHAAALLREAADLGFNYPDETFNPRIRPRKISPAIPNKSPNTSQLIGRP